MERRTIVLILASCLLSLLSFVPTPVDLIYSNALLSPNVSISFICIAVSSFPMLLDCLWDLLSKFKLIQMGSSRDHSYLTQRLVIFIGFIYPTIGYFLLKSFNWSRIGIYYTALTNSQTIWVGGAFLAILHFSKSSIWTFRWCLCLVFLMVGNTISFSFFDAGVAVQILYYLATVALVIIFFYLYSKTIICVRRNAATEEKSIISSADYFCLVYATLIMINFFLVIVLGTIIYGLWDKEISIIYSNMASTVSITIANMIPNRREEDIKLESTEQSLAMKQAFVRYLSHEMRTPINVALVGLMMLEQYLEERNLLTDECKDTLTDVKSAVDVALETLNEALNYEKLQSKVMALEKTREDPLSFVLSSTSMFKATAASAGVSLILPQAAEVSWLGNSWIDIDIRKMSQVMRNFMSNALKFTPTGGSITVSLGLTQQPLAVGRETGFSLLPQLCQKNRSSPSDPCWLEISVKDEGVGIEPEYLPRIFNEVLQINPNKNQGGKGTGMGLLISKGIAELHEGRVEVHSDGPGQGSCFKVLLPLHLEQAPPPLPPSTAAAARGASTATVFPFDVSGNEVSTTINNARTVDESDRKDRDCISYDPNSELSSLDLPQRDQNRRAWDVKSTYNSTEKVMSSHGDLCIYSIEDGTTTTLVPIEATSKLVKASQVDHDGQQRKPRHGSSPSGSGNEWDNDRLRGKKVLMVDDSPTNLKMCVKLLQRLGADVDKAEDGRIAADMVRSLLQDQADQTSSLSAEQQPSLLKLEEQQLTRDRHSLYQSYDLVLMDNQMPHMSGAEACKAMRAMGFTGIIIGLTGNAFEQEIADYIAQGANAVLTKPLVLAHLFETLRQIDAESKV